MKRATAHIIFCPLLVFLLWASAQAQGQFPYDVSWTSDPGDTSLGFSGDGINTVINNKLGLRAGFDFDNDGNLEFLTSLQSSNESADRDNNLYLFEVDGNDNFALRWNYRVENVPHQRNSLGVGDLDNNGLAEIIFVIDQLTQSDDNVFIFEYDPNLGNFPSTPTATWNTPRDGDGEFRCEVDFKITDIDQDGSQEMIMVSFDGVVIASLASSDFSNPQFNVEYSNFSEMIWTFSSAVADLDNNGRLELVTAGGWGLGAFNILEAIAPDFYILAVNLGISSLPGGTGSYNAMTAADLDGNGFAEIYYADTDGNFRVFYTNGAYDSISESDFHLLVSAGSEVLTIIPEDSTFYIGTSSASEVFRIEYFGGDIAEPLNFQATQIYADTAAAPGAITIFRIAGAMDLDGDGKKEIVFAAANHDHTRPTLFVIEEGTTTAVAETDQSQVPADFRLEQNYPNPFNPSTTIAFYLPLEESVTLKIYSAMGREVRTLIDNQTYFKGQHQITWDGRDNRHNPVASGVYIYRLVLGHIALSKSMTLVR